METNQIKRSHKRIGQLIIMPYPQVSFTEVDNLPDSDRGTGDYGSTGR